MYFEGRPLVYYDCRPSAAQGFSYFRKFEEYSKMSDELPSSPHSTQSDSDASFSSVDVHPEPIHLKFSKTPEVRCCWQNCGIVFETLERLSDHVSKVHAISGLGGLYYCLWEGCTRNNKGFNARYKMLVHVRTHTNEKPHQCALCHKSFSRAENLKIHTRSHSGERPYVCPVPGCNKAYSNSSDRFKHTRTHQVDKPYQCKVPGCTKRYTDPSSLRKHVKTYKHFANEPKKEETEPQKPPPLELRTSSVIVTQPANAACNCDHLPHCYYSKCLRDAGYINEKQSWSALIEPYFSYQHKNDMEIDLPLDLSIRRHF